MTAKVYAVAQSVPEGVSGFITAGKQYEVIGGTSRWFGFIDDEGCRITTDWSQSRMLNGGNWTRIDCEEPAAEAPADAMIAALSDGLILEIRGAIKATEYKYFGDYELSEDQQNAVAVLVAAAEMLLARAAFEGVRQ